MKNTVRFSLPMFITTGMLVFTPSALCTGQTAPVIGLHTNTPNVVALKGARVVVSPGNVLENATIIVRDGLIDGVGADIGIPRDAEVRNCTGKTVYPGLIDIHTHYGMPPSPPEIPGTGTRNWNTLVRPERHAADLFKPDDATAQKYRKSGFAAAVTFPQPGIFRGEGALVLMTGDKPNDAVLREGIAQSLSLHESSSDYPESLQGRIALIRQTLLDANWYRTAWTAYRNEPGGQKAPDTDLSLASLDRLIDGRIPAVFDAPDLLDLFRAAAIAREFKLDIWVRGSGAEYRRIEAVKNAGGRLILPLDFPEPPDVSTDEANLRELRHWDFAPENPARLSQAGVEFALTADGIDNMDTFLKSLRTAVRRGLPAEKALASLTTVPAGWLGVSNVLGTLEKGKLASFFITDGDLFEEKTKILDTWVQGKRYEINALPIVEVRGSWTLRLEPGDRIQEAEFEISGEQDKPKTKMKIGGKSIDALQTDIDKRLIMVAAATDSLGYPGVMRMTGFVEGSAMTGRGTWADGVDFRWNAALKEPWKAPTDTTKVKPVKMAEFPVVYPEGAFGRTELPSQPDAVLVKNAVLWTCGPKGIIDKGDLLVKKGKIAEIGKNLKAPDNAVVIDAEGRHVTPGLLDAHSHLAIDGGVNEGSHSITSETRIGDVLDSDDINIYRQLAGGLTTACIIHGSANTIGGQNAVIKLRWGALPGEMFVTDAPPGIKFALGENVKQSNIMGQVTRYPLSRMGVEEFFRDSFSAAKDYRTTWQEYEKEKKKRKNLIPPRRDLRLEPLVEVLDGKRQIQCHAYRQDEVLSLIRLADEMGFKVGLFIHILEGYKVADVMKKHGAMPTTFTDWWAYKFEVYDAIPYNGALMRDQGLLVSLNSDDTELARRMNFEAAKAVKYGDVPGEEALKFVTINSAKQLGIDNHIGSLETGKDADFVIWSGSPLSTYSRCEQTWIDGRRYFDRNEDQKLREEVRRQRAALIQKVMQKDK